jgi:hypothetical protein
LALASALHGDWPVSRRVHVHVHGACTRRAALPGLASRLCSALLSVSAKYATTSENGKRAGNLAQQHPTRFRFRLRRTSPRVKSRGKSIRITRSGEPPRVSGISNEVCFASSTAKRLLDLCRCCGSLPLTSHVASTPPPAPALVLAPVARSIGPEDEGKGDITGPVVRWQRHQTIERSSDQRYLGSDIPNQIKPNQAHPGSRYRTLTSHGGAVSAPKPAVGNHHSVPSVHPRATSPSPSACRASPLRCAPQREALIARSSARRE